MSNKTVAIEKRLTGFSKATLVKVLATIAAEPVCTITDKLLFSWLESLDMVIKIESVNQETKQTAHKIEALAGKDSPRARRQFNHLFNKYNRLQERLATLVKKAEALEAQNGM